MSSRFLSRCEWFKLFQYYLQFMTFRSITHTPLIQLIFILKLKFYFSNSRILTMCSKSSISTNSWALLHIIKKYKITRIRVTVVKNIAWKMITTVLALKTKKYAKDERYDSKLTPINMIWRKLINIRYSWHAVAKLCFENGKMPNTFK